MRHCSVCLLALCLGTASVFAQDSIIRYQRPARVILKLAPLWLLDADPALAGAVEVRTGSRTSVQGEFGYGWPGWGSLSGADQHAGTWRVKAEMRFYSNRYRTSRQRAGNVATTYPLGNYQAVEVYAKLLNVTHIWTYYDPTLNPSVVQGEIPNRRTLIRRNSLSLTYKVGRQFGWTDHAHQGAVRLLWDVYAGIGIRLINQDNGGNWGVPGYTSSFRGINRFQTTGFKVLPTLSAGIKLSFAL